MTVPTAGEVSNKLAADETKYDALEVGHHMADDIEKHLYEAARAHLSIIDEPEYCVVMVIAGDPLIPNLRRRKFYCWPYLPKPRPNQSVFLYNRAKDKIIKRLWVLPSDMVMAELAGTSIIVDKQYETMQAWSVAFFKGVFWDYVRHDQGISMLSEHEYVLQNRQKLIEAGCQIPAKNIRDPFDFSKIQIKKIIDAQTPMIA